MWTFDYRLTKSPYYKYLLRTIGKECYTNERWTIIYYHFSKDYSIEIWHANTYSKTRQIEIDLVHRDPHHLYPCIKRISKVPQNKVLWVIELLKKFARKLTPDDYDVNGFLKESIFGARRIIYCERDYKPVDPKKFEKELKEYLKHAKFDFSIVDEKVFKGGKH